MVSFVSATMSVRLPYLPLKPAAYEICEVLSIIGYCCRNTSMHVF